jgi:DNA ligase D-like protein (predicted polymerase)
MPAGDKIAVQVDGRDLTLTNLAKVLYPSDGFTKAEVLDYYQRISPVLLPHVAGRPMTLKRYPDGVNGQSFFAKHAPAGLPDWMRTGEIETSSSRSKAPGEPVVYVVIDDLPSLMWAANLAALELHVPMWRFPDHGKGSRSAAPEHGRTPDLLVFDLDPGAPANITDCCRVAEALRPVLAEDGLDALPKTSGGKGLQLYADIRDRKAGRLPDDEVPARRQGPHRLVAEQRLEDDGRALFAAGQGAPHRLCPGHLGRGGRLPRSRGHVLHRARRARPGRGARRPVRPPGQPTLLCGGRGVTAG